MPDGAGKDVSAVLMELIAQTSRIEAKVDGLVSHERMAEVVNMSRAEWRNDIRDALREARQQDKAERAMELQQAITLAEEKLRTEIKRSNDEQDLRAKDQEARDRNIEQRVKTSMGVSIAIGFSMLGYAIARAVGWVQ